MTGSETISEPFGHQSPVPCRRLIWCSVSQVDLGATGASSMRVGRAAVKHQAMMAEVLPDGAAQGPASFAVDNPDPV